jgi:KipI family sensor histidine kinase inhibitor
MMCSWQGGDEVRVRRVGANALLLDCADEAEVEAWRTELWRLRGSGHVRAEEIVPGARTLLLDGVPDVEAVTQLIAGRSPRRGDGFARGPLIEIPVVYSGEDLPAVADLCGISERGVINRLSRAELRVAFCGFAPGWAYLTGLPPELAVPRLDSPRTRVPAGSVALANGYAGIYPNASPGGWRLVGHTEVRLFDVEREPPALLAPGTRVRLVEAA